MRINGSELSQLDDLTDSEYDLFSESLATLLSRSFIVRALDREERLYDFTIRNISLIEAWFSCAGIALKRDESLGVISCRPPASMRMRLTREETCALLALRLLYEERRKVLTLAKYPTVPVLDFLSRYRALTDRDLVKTRFVEILRKFNQYKLVSAPEDALDPDAVIGLYPSVALALDQSAIDEISRAIAQEQNTDDDANNDDGNEGENEE